MRYVNHSEKNVHECFFNDYFNDFKYSNYICINYNNIKGIYGVRWQVKLTETISGAKNSNRCALALLINMTSTKQVDAQISEHQQHH